MSGRERTVIRRSHDTEDVPRLLLLGDKISPQI